MCILHRIDVYNKKNWQRRDKFSPAKKKKNKRKNVQHLLYERYKAGVLGYDLLGEPSSKYDFVVYYGKGDPLVNKKERLAGRRE